MKIYTLFQNVIKYRYGFSILIIKEKINLDYIGDYDDTEFEDDDEDEDDPDYEDFRIGDDDDDHDDLPQKWFISLFYSLN